MNVFVFDIESVPDVAGAKRLDDYAGLSDEQVVAALLALTRQRKKGNDFLPLYLHKIVCISVVFSSPEGVKVWSLGNEHASEQEIITRFFDGLEKYTPILVSYNGVGYDLPVLHYRALIHGVSAAKYWENGAHDQSFRYNNYLNRYHERHTDVMDVLAAFQPRAFAPLDKLSSLLGFPGKMGMSGAKVWDAFHEGNIKSIRDYCETDVLNTYLVFLRFQLMRGQLTQTQYAQELTRLKKYLQAQNKTHFTAFLDVWNAAVEVDYAS